MTELGCVVESSNHWKASPCCVYDINLQFNTYKGYKVGTARFTSWLVGVAQNSGIAIMIETFSNPSAQKASETKDRTSETSAAYVKGLQQR